MVDFIKNNLEKRFKTPNDVYEASEPLYIFSTCFGLAPYGRAKSEKGHRIFKFTWLSLLRSALVLVILVASILYHEIFRKSGFKDLDMRGKLRYVQEVFSCMLSCGAVVFGAVFSFKVKEVFQNIEELDVSFRSLAIWVPYRGLYVKILVHLTLVFLFIALLTGALLYISGISQGRLYGFILTFNTIVLPHFVNLLMELQYFHYLDILRSRYKLLNEYLETLVEEENKPSEAWTDDLNITTISHSGSSNKNKVTPKNSPNLAMNNTVKNKVLPKSMMAIFDPVFVVDQVAALHIKLTDTAHMINYAFCVQLLLNITVAFISIVTALFLIAINFSKTPSQSGESSESESLDILFTAWAFSNICEVMGIVWITSETCEEANTCPRILHKIRNNTENTNLQDTIEIYSLQMYHNRLYFTVCGLFPLDYTLLYAIVAGVTTYLVILIQFNNADFVKKTPNSTTTLAVTTTIATTKF